MSNLVGGSDCREAMTYSTELPAPISSVERLLTKTTTATVDTVRNTTYSGEIHRRGTLQVGNNSA